MFFNSSADLDRAEERQKREAKAAVELLKEDVLNDKRNSAMFYAKIQEEREMLTLFKEQCSILASELANSPRNDRLIPSYWYDRKLKQKQECERRLKRYEWARRVCLGRQERETLDVERAREYPIEDILGAPESKGGGRWKYKCVFHSERTASFVLYKSQNKWHCFGCQAGGDVIELAMKLYKIGFKEAVQKLS